VAQGRTAESIGETGQTAQLTELRFYTPLDTKRSFRRSSSKPISWLILITTTTTTILRPFFRDNLDEPVPEENFWTLWCKGRLTEADTLTTRLGATPSGLTSAHLHHPHILFTSRMSFLLPNQQHQSTEGN